MCDKCDDAGFYRLDVVFGDPRFGKLFRCECRAAEDAKRLQQLSGLTGTERAQTLDMIDTLDKPGTREMVERCKQFIEYPTIMLTIWGGTGNAKTMALQSVVNHFVSAGVEAVYITAFDLISHLKEAFYQNERQVVAVRDESAYSRLMKFERVRILAIDELDKVRVTDWVREQLTDLIDRRYRLSADDQAGTLIAMNANPQSLDGWVASRLSEGLIVHNGDHDMRPALGQLRFVTDPRTGETIG